MATITTTVTESIATVTSTIATTVTKASSSASPTSTHRAAPQGGILEGGNPTVYNASNPIILFIIQVCLFSMICATREHASMGYRGITLAEHHTIVQALYLQDIKS